MMRFLQISRLILVKEKSLFLFFLISVLENYHVINAYVKYDFECRKDCKIKYVML